LVRSGISCWTASVLERQEAKYPIGRAQSRRDAEALLRERAYQASAGTLPGTVSFEQIALHLT